MRVLLIGATGTIGSRLVPQLRQGGLQVIGTCRSSAKCSRLRALGAKPVVLDTLDAKSVRITVQDAQPDAIVYQVPGISHVSDIRHLDVGLAPTDHLRTEGTDNVLAAARAFGVDRIIAQSCACHRYARVGGPVKTEDDPVDPNPPAAMQQSVAAMAHLDKTVTAAGGIALRYGSFYGEPLDPLVAAVRARRFPILGDGEGVWSFVHVEDAAAAVVLALDHDGPAIYNVADDEPAPTSVWLTELAKTVGARPPRRLPRTLARIVAGEALTIMSTESRGASNARAKRELGWAPRYPSWREGFVAALSRP